MKLIFFQKVINFGGLGDLVDVKLGYGCNFFVLIGKVVLVILVNVVEFEVKCVDYEVKVQLIYVDVEVCKVKLEGVSVIIVVNVLIEGKLYGLVGLCDIVEVFIKNGLVLEKSEVILGEGVFCNVGEYEVIIYLYVDVEIIVKVVVEVEV